MVKLLFVTCAIALGVASPARADSVNTLSGWDGYTGIDGVGEYWAYSVWMSRSLAQTFKVTSPEARLNTMTFAVNDMAPVYEAQATKMDVVVMEWSGSSPTGSVLYRTGPVVSPNGSAWSTMTVSLGNTLVQSDKEYIAILTTSNYMDGIQNKAMAAFAWDNYADGYMVFYDGFGPGDELTGSWTGIGSVDLGVVIDYTPIPEPATVSLLAIGAAGILRKRRHSRP
jgi:hypothetical protein